MSGFKSPRGGFKAGGGFKSGGPLDVVAESEEPGQFRDEVAAELSVMQDAYRKRNVAEKKRRTAATDSEFWIAVCFTDRAEKERFLAAVGVMPDLHGDKYINGRVLAAKLGLRI